MCKDFKFVIIVAFILKMAYLQNRIFPPGGVIVYEQIFVTLD